MGLFSRKAKTCDLCEKEFGDWDKKYKRDKEQNIQRNLCYPCYLKEIVIRRNHRRHLANLNEQKEQWIQTEINNRKEQHLSDNANKMSEIEENHILEWLNSRWDKEVAPKELEKLDKNFQDLLGNPNMRQLEEMAGVKHEDTYEYQNFGKYKEGS